VAKKQVTPIQAEQRKNDHYESSALIFLSATA